MIYRQTHGTHYCSALELDNAEDQLSDQISPRYIFFSYHDPQNLSNVHIAHHCPTINMMNFKNSKISPFNRSAAWLVCIEQTINQPQDTTRNRKKKCLKLEVLKKMFLVKPLEDSISSKKKKGSSRSPNACARRRKAWWIHMCGPRCRRFLLHRYPAQRLPCWL